MRTAKLAEIMYNFLQNEASTNDTSILEEARRHQMNVIEDDNTLTITVNGEAITIFK